MSLALLAALVACTTPAPDAPTPEPADAPAPEAAPEPAPEAPSKPDWHMRKHMDMHFAFVTDALWLTFGGNLDGVKTEAAKLAEHAPTDPRDEAWKPFMDEMYAKSLAMKDLDSLDDAANSLVDLADTCAGCHQANNGPKLTEEDMKIAPLFFEDKAMDRHQWAVYMMWIGLIAPNDQMWVNGTKAFAHPKGALPPAANVEAVKPLENRVHDLAARGTSAETREEKGKVFAELITTCAACHTKLGVDPTGTLQK